MPLSCSFAKPFMILLYTKYLQRNFTYSGLQRIETWEYPEMALREAILNAIIHRDYGENAFFTIKVFDNMLEIWNQGDLMEPLNIESLKKQHLSRLRNKVIANIFYRSGQIESWGRGTLKILENAREGGYPKPEFENFMGGILVRFGRKNFAENQTEADRKVDILANVKYAGKIFALIQENSKIKTSEMAKILSVSNKTIERVLSTLLKEKIIAREGAKKDGFWNIV